jgi:hydroxymethylglutaryl-CoA reductase (NADPH)
VDGKLRFHELSSDLSAAEAAAIRRAAIERLTGAQAGRDRELLLRRLHRGPEELREPHRRRPDSRWGSSGPLTVRGEHVDGDVYIPLATTEGALLASINRGCTAIRAAGRRTVHVDDVGMTRAPVFRTRSQRETRAFLKWVRRNAAEIRPWAKARAASSS